MGTADPDECYWRQRGDHGAYFLVVLRLFYVVGPPAYEEICKCVPDRLYAVYVLE